MSKKLLFNEGGESGKVPVLNKYTGTKSGYPIEINSNLLDEEEKTYIEEIYGNTWQDATADITRVFSSGIEKCGFIFERYTYKRYNFLVLPHTNDGRITTMDSFNIPQNYKLVIKVADYNDDSGSSAYALKVFLPNYNSSQLSYIPLNSTIKPAIDNNGYYLYEWTNTTNSDIQSTIAIENYFGTYYVSDIIIAPSEYTEEDLFGEEVEISNEDFANHINSIGINTVKWTTTSNGKIRCTASDGWFDTDFINSANRNNAFIQLKPNTNYVLKIYGIYTTDFSFVVSDTKKLAHVVNPDEGGTFTQDNPNGSYGIGFTTDGSGKVCFGLTNTNMSSEVDMKLFIANDGSSLEDIRSVGDTVIDDVYEIEVIQGTCPYEFGKGGRL